MVWQKAELPSLLSRVDYFVFFWMARFRNDLQNIRQGNETGNFTYGRKTRFRAQFAKIEPSIPLQPHRDKSLFEILIFLSLDSNVESSSSFLRADTVFRAVWIEMAAQGHLQSTLHGFQRNLVPEIRIGTGPSLSALIRATGFNPGRVQVNT
jgi:hypothetical protein